jgi:hypothetical protein
MNTFFSIVCRLMLCCLCLSSCSEIATITYYNKIIDVEEKIQATIGNASCNSDTQCKVLYLEAIETCVADIAVAFSDANNIEAQLFELESQRRSYIYQNLLLSGNGTICTKPPRFTRTARCVNQRCILQ